MIYNAERKDAGTWTQELIAAGIPVKGVNCIGERVVSVETTKDLTAQEKAAVEALIGAKIAGVSA